MHPHRWNKGKDDAGRSGCTGGLCRRTFLILSAQNSFAQHPKGIVHCMAFCSKSDHGCQDRCIPHGLRSDERACIETCRQRATGPHLFVELTRCVSACLGTPKYQFGMATKQPAGSPPALETVDRAGKRVPRLNRRSRRDRVTRQQESGSDNAVT